MDPREEWQDEACEIWSKAGGKGVVEAGTGTGKTFLGIKVAKKYTATFGLDQIHIVVPTKLLKKQWESLIPSTLPNIEVFVIKTYVSEPRFPKLLIMDEMHNYMAPSYRQIMKSSATHILGLTATLKRKDGLHALMIQKVPLVYRLPIEKARKLGFVSDFQVYNLGVDFNNQEDRMAYQKKHKSFVSLFGMFDHNFTLLMDCVKGSFQALNSVAGRNACTIDKAKTYAFIAMNAMRSRQKMLYECKSKLPILKEVISKVNGQSIVFTQTIDSCNEIVNLLENSVAYHSGIKGIIENGKRISSTAVQQRIIQDFEKKKYTTLVGAKGINEGLSVNAVECAVMFSYTSDIRTFVQRMGRAVRFVEGKKAKIISLYMKPFEFEDKKVSSQELKWLKDAQRSQIGSVKWVDTVDEIFNEDFVTF